MKTSPIFTPKRNDIDRMIAANPLATLVSSGAEGLSASPLPLLLERDASGAATLLGHFARANPQIEELEQRPDALVVFMGPHGYVSPSWFTDRTQAPTWNYMTVHMQVRVRIDRSRAAAEAAVKHLTARMESGRQHAWSPADLGERFGRLIPGVVAFRADVLRETAKFKLGQNERPDVLAEALNGLASEANIALAKMMRDANAGRLDSIAEPVR